jgi:FkbM family methyltransferase
MWPGAVHAAMLRVPGLALPSDDGVDPALRFAHVRVHSYRRLRTRLDRYVAGRVAAGVAAAQQPTPADPLHGTYVGDGRMLVKTTWGGKLLVPTSDLSLMPELVAKGTYDVPFTAFVREHLEPGNVAFDVGAHIGVFTVLMAYEVWEMGRVVAYEANPHNLRVLRENVTMSYLDDRVEIVPRAAAATAGRAELLAPERFQMMGSIQRLDEALLVTKDRPQAIERIPVDTEPLDVHCGRFERIDLVKIDVEGAEEQVFAGMDGLLESGVVKRVAFELYRRLLGDDWESLARRLKHLEARGWRFATLPDSGIPERVSLDRVLERGEFSQVVMTRGDCF